MATPSCGAPPGTAPSDWLRHAIRLLPSASQNAAACLDDVALADPTADPPLQRLVAALPSGGAPPMLRALGEARLAANDWLAAVDAFAETLAIEPGDCISSANMAHALSALGDHSAAVSTLRAALAEDHACVLAHHGLARLLPHLGDVPAALRHVRAALELRPFDSDYEHTLRALLDMQGDEEDESNEAERRSRRSTSGIGGQAGLGKVVRGQHRGDLRHADASEPLDEAAAAGAAAADTVARTGSACGAPLDWQSPPLPDDLSPSAGSCASGTRGLLLINPFEEGCFHDDLRSKARQEYFSCGQFNNVLASLIHALALSRILCRTLILPGFFIRFGARLTRVSPFAERWMPTSHFLNVTAMAAAFDVLELRDW